MAAGNSGGSRWLRTGVNVENGSDRSLPPGRIAIALQFRGKLPQNLAKTSLKQRLRTATRENRGQIDDRSYHRYSWSFKSRRLNLFNDGVEGSE